LAVSHCFGCCDNFPPRFFCCIHFSPANNCFLCGVLFYFFASAVLFFKLFLMFFLALLLCLHFLLSLFFTVFFVILPVYSVFRCPVLRSNFLFLVLVFFFLLLSEFLFAFFSNRFFFPFVFPTRQRLLSFLLETRPKNFADDFPSSFSLRPLLFCALWIFLCCPLGVLICPFPCDSFFPPFFFFFSCIRALQSPTRSQSLLIFLSEKIFLVLLLFFFFFFFGFNFCKG